MKNDKKYVFGLHINKKNNIKSNWYKKYMVDNVLFGIQIQKFNIIKED